MALITAVTFLIFLVALLFTNVKFGISAILSSPLQGGRLMRMIVPFTLVFPPLVAYFRMIGERYGFYPPEVGVQISVLVFMSVLLTLLFLFASSGNDRNAAENRIVSLMNALSEGVLQTDTYGIVLFCNPAIGKILGYGENELIGRSALDVLVPKKDRETFKKRLSDRQQGKEEQYKSELLTKDGHRIWISIKSNILKDEWGNICGFLVSMQDITDETLQLQDLQAFSASAAHDLNSPLANIEMLTGVIDIDILEEEQRELIFSIGSEIKRMKTLLSDLLTFSKMGSAQMPVEEIKMSDLFAEVTEPFKKQPVKFIHGNLPPIRANLPAVRQLLTNLISNAVKYSSRAPRPVVDIRSTEKDQLTWFSVSDNGIGMASEQLPDLFKPFKRFTTQFGGNGLGLAIVKRIVERHGGQIYASRNENGGLTFHFTLSTEAENPDVVPA